MDPEDAETSASGASATEGTIEPAPETYVRALEQSPLAIMCVATARGRYAWVTQGFADMLGVERQAVVRADPYQTWLDVTHPDDIPAERAHIERAAAGEIDAFELDKRMRHATLGYRWVHVSFRAARDAAGRLEYITVYFTDLEPQRAAERARERVEGQLLAAQRLGMLGQLTGGIAHDFNNRLLIVMGHTELLRRGLPSESPLGVHADVVLASAKRAAELTRQLLAYSRRQVLKPEAFDLNLSVDRLRRMLERLIGDDISLRTELRARHPVLADPGQIEQVLLNLVLNARDAMPAGGSLLVETGDVSHAGDARLREGEYVTLRVSDTGTGIADDVLPRIFEPFFTTKSVGKGTGLGLSTVEGIVSQSNGVTQVESRVGEGTRFTVYLPRAERISPEAAADTPSARGAREEAGFETVLVCDDDEGVRNLLVDVLSFRGYAILEARNGKEALEVARAHGKPIHLLVTDVVMAELGGVELYATLRRLVPGLKALFVSGYADDPAFLSRSLEPGTYFLPKPFLPAELTEAACSLLEGRPLAQQRQAGRLEAESAPPRDLSPRNA